MYVGLYTFMQRLLQQYLASIDTILLGKGSRLVNQKAVTLLGHQAEDKTVSLRITQDNRPFRVHVYYHDSVNTKQIADCTCAAYLANLKCEHTIAAALFLQQHRNWEEQIMTTLVAPPGETDRPHPIGSSPDIRLAAAQLKTTNIPNLKLGLSPWELSNLTSDKHCRAIIIEDHQLEFQFYRTFGAGHECQVNVSSSDKKSLTVHRGTCSPALPCKHQKAVLLLLAKEENKLLSLLLQPEKMKNAFKKSLFIPEDADFDAVANLAIAGLQVYADIHDKSLMIGNKDTWSQWRAEKRSVDVLPLALPTEEEATPYQLIYKWEEYITGDINRLPLQISAVVTKPLKNGTLSRKTQSIKDFLEETGTAFPLTAKQAALIQQLDIVFSEKRPNYYLNLAEQNNIKLNPYAVDRAPFILEAMQRDLASIFGALIAEPNYRLDETGLVPIRLSKQAVEVRVELTADDQFLYAEVQFLKDGQQLSGAVLLSPFFLMVDEDIFPIPAGLQVLTQQIMRQPKLKWFRGAAQDAYDIFIAPYSEQAQIINKSGLSFRQEVWEEVDTVECRIYLKEQSTRLLLIPAFEYKYGKNKIEVPFSEAQSIRIPGKTQDTVLMRDKAVENEFIDWLRGLHADFVDQGWEACFHLREEEVMKNGWLLHAIRQWNERGVAVLGQKQLKRYNYNTHAPSMRLSAGTGIDWFDLQVKVSFGDQELKLLDLRNAILNRQTYVRLGDGSIGLLPEEWLEKYKTLFLSGHVKKDRLQLNQFHVTMIDELYNEIDNNEPLLALHDKIRRLHQFDGLPSVKPPKNIKATLRNYQVTGFEWLCFLDEYGWGGCLADDMGLGKTLQMLTFLQHKVNNSDSFTALVVVPTSLLFNWENEIAKFAPDMKYLVHSGLTRKREVDHFSDYNIVITSYGVLRRDVSFFRDFEFDYIVLDESQAIKNPLAQTSKAMKLLRAKNRLVMTGTPVENSVFDLFSQFDFLNPGMLGSLEAFRWQYAAQIDRELDEEALVRLRKLIYPFVLNRKKNQVAKELPEKTETVVYCEMDDEQRKVYRNYQMRVRKELDEMMKEQGVAASSLHILQAFTKLRQICNSPRLLSDDLQDQHLVDGVKMNVLTEQLEALVNEGHKVLVFSFFTSMLKLVEEKLNAKSINHVKITGDTVDRKGKVDTFQEDENVKVFLISLKAGGTGLNLTAADYVYIIDPWWNPAVEQQAIDRTHRIGQTKHIFAYKLICKDSIEEKMLQLQEQKKSLVTELISGDQGWMKKLTREDVMELLNA